MAQIKSNNKKKSSTFYSIKFWRGATFALAFAFVGVTLLLTTFAAKPVRSNATLSVTPNPAAANGTQYTITGCGYTVGVAVDFNIHKPSALQFFNVGTDENGCIKAVSWTDEPGTYTIEARQQLRKRQVLMATTTLDVQ